LLLAAGALVATTSLAFLGRFERREDNLSRRILADIRGNITRITPDMPVWRAVEILDLKQYRPKFRGDCISLGCYSFYRFPDGSCLCIVSAGRELMSVNYGPPGASDYVEFPIPQLEPIRLGASVRSNRR
jgi:hypothetical protein